MKNLNNPKAVRKLGRRLAARARLQHGRDARNRLKPKTAETAKPAMLFLAEKTATKQEITKLLEAEAQRWLSVTTFKPSQARLVKHLHQWLKRFDFARFSRKKTVEQVAARMWRRRRGW
jgi:hypothetical protein